MNMKPTVEKKAIKREDEQHKLRRELLQLIVKRESQRKAPYREPCTKEA